MHSYCSNNAVTLLKEAKSLKNSIYNEFLKLKFTRILIDRQQANQPSPRPSSTGATALEFLHNKGNHFGFTKLLF